MARSWTKRQADRPDTWFRRLQARLGEAFPALGHRNFRLFWIGQCISLVGTWMQSIGQSWLVVQLTGSPLKLGVVNALQWLPVLCLSFVAGPLVDRWPKRRILIVTQSILLGQALVLAVLVWTGAARYWHVLVLALVLGCVNCLDNPARQSFVIELAGRDHLMNAISLNSTIFNLARLLGPAVAGLLIDLVGLAPCFFINALSFLAPIWALTRLRLDEDRSAPPPLRLGELARSIGAGFRYLGGNPVILWPVVLVGLLSLFIINYNVVIPIYARDALGGGPREFGFLMAALGVGSTVGALALAARSRGGPQMALLLLGALGMSVFSLLAGLQHGFGLACLLLALTGFCQVTCTAQTNAVIQIASSDAMRGRVMSLYMLSFGGVSPLGSLYAGWLVARAGAGADLVVSGALGLAATGWCAYALGRRRGEDGAAG
jgi:predicted MFS family arabinose efflux permease